jgi:hypothetical protein
MGADSFNENDLADLNSTEPAPSESPEFTPEQQANIDAAYEKFMEKAPADLEVAEKKEEPAVVEKPVATDIAERRRARNRQARLEQTDELREEGLEVAEGDEAETKAEGKTETKVEAKPAVVENEQTPAPTDIDPTLRYFAEQELGWAKDKIDRLVKADPEIAAETLQNIADTYTNLSRQYAAGTQVAPGTQTPTPTQTEDAPLTPRLDKFYSALADFKESNGDELGEFTEALKAELIDPVKKIFADNMVRERELNKDEAQTTYGKLSEKFADIYGKAGVAKTPEQIEAVRQLGEVADQLRAGAKQRGQKMSIKSAMNQAHMQVSAPFREAIVRKNLKEQIHKRENAITHRPSQRLVPSLSSGKSDAAAEEAIAKFAAERGLDGWD